VIDGIGICDIAKIEKRKTKKHNILGKERK
jgi:hypothetical protein